MTTTTKISLAAALSALALAASAQNEITETVTPVDGTPVSVSSGQAKPLDRIVAVVNNDVITEFELQNRTHQAAINLRRQEVPLPPMEQLRAQVLDRLITEKAIQQRAKETGIRVDEQMISAAIDQIARNNRLTTEELRSRLQQEGVTFSAFRQQIRDEITVQRLREREVDQKITIPESEIDAYLAEKAGFTSGDTVEYHIGHIILPFNANDEDSVKSAQKLAEDLRSRANKGEDFGKLAASYSKSEDALSGGDLGWRDSTRMPSLYWQAVQASTKDDSTTIIRTPSAFHIVKPMGTRDGVKAKLAGAPVPQSHVRHILLFVSDLTPEAQVISRLNDIRHRVLAGEDFAKYARLVSVDNSATRGGDLGWMQAGDADPEFERVVNSLQPGEISEPFRTQYGYHIVQVLERRTQSADATRSRLAARQALREKKLAEAVNDWQRELHDRAYVEIRRENL